MPKCAEQPTFFPRREEIEREWGLALGGVEPLRVGHGAQLLLRADDGAEWILKRCRVKGLGVRRLEATLAALERLRPGFEPELLPRIHPCRDGRHVHEREGHCFYVMARVAGRRPSYRRELDVAAVLSAQGRLHERGAEAGLTLARELNEPAAISLDALWREPMAKLAALEDRLAEARAVGLPATCRFFAARQGAMVELAARAEAYLRARVGDLSTATLPVTLIHGDSHENNYLLVERPSAGTWMIDLESSMTWPAVTDLVVPLGEFGQRRGWAIAPLRRLLAAYEQHRPLSPAERALLGAMLIFPRQWLRSMSSLVRRGGDLGAARGLALCLFTLPAQRRLADQLEREP